MSEPMLAVIALVVLYGFTGGLRFGQMSIISLFIYAQATMAIGTLPELDATLAADAMHVTVIVWSLATLVIVSILYSFIALKAKRVDYAPEVEYSYPKGAVWFWIIVSILISVAYYVSVGYIAFFESIQALASNSGEDIAGLRLESYAGSRYFFPGYVNQFKNALLPALTIVVIVAAYHFRRSGRLPLAIGLVVANLVFLLGTGQRGAFVLALALTVIVAYLTGPRGFRKYFARIAIVGLALFFVATFAGGRVAQDLAAAPDLGSQVGILFEQLAFRILGSNQTSSITGFRYIYEQTIPVGSEWGQAIVGLLPGQAGSDLSNRIFAVLYGSTRGTAPLSLWGSVYHNFGFVGVFVIAIIIALILCKLAHSMNANRGTNLIQVAGMAGVTVSIASWIADGPSSILNTGVVMYALLWIWGRAIAKKAEKVAAVEPVAEEAPKRPFPPRRSTTQPTTNYSAGLERLFADHPRPE